MIIYNKDEAAFKAYLKILKITKTPLIITKDKIGYNAF